MSVITLLSDFGYSDPYLIQLKAVLWRMNPQAQLVDLAHGVDKYNIAQASFVLRNSLLLFPKDSIHIVAVDTAQNHNGRYLLAKIDEQWVLGSDNGLFSLLSDDAPSALYELDKESLSSFAGVAILAPVAAQLSLGKVPDNFGSVTDAYQKLHLPAVKKDEHKLTGHVVYVDSYGNLITNITKEDFESASKGRTAEVSFKTERLPRISKHYYDDVGGNCIALFNNMGLLEIAQVDGDASRLLGMRYLSQVDVNFGASGASVDEMSLF